MSAVCPPSVAKRTLASDRHPSRFMSTKPHGHRPMPFDHAGGFNLNPLDSTVLCVSGTGGTRRPQNTSKMGVPNMHVAIFVTAVAIVVGFAVPTCADDRPRDPFGNHTIELNKETPLVEIWESLRDQVLLDKAHFHSCIESNNEPNDCAAVSTLMKIVEEARQNQGKAVLGHLNRSINLLINAAPGYLTGPLEVITVRNGDCKSHSIAKYAAARAAGFSADHVRLVTVHDRPHNFDHMVATVYYNEEWLILDNLTNLLVRDAEKRDYEPLAVLDYKGVRRYHSVFWMFD